MSKPPKGEVTELLIQWSHGSDDALERLTPMLYDELKRLAHHYLRDERKEPLLQTTALVHEAYVRLIGLDTDWQGRSHFIAISARLMRQVLVDQARRRKADKRGGDTPVVSLEDEGPEPKVPLDPFLALHEALQDLASVDERKNRVLELKYFAGASVAEIAEILQVGHRTVERDLRLGRAWLANAMGSTLPA